MKSARSPWLVGACLAAWVAAGSGGGCYQPDQTRIDFGTVSVSSGGTADGGAGGGTEITPQAYFEDNVKEPLNAYCSGCHSEAPRAFLLAGQEYSVLTQYRTSWGQCLLSQPASLSPLLTFPDTDVHAEAAERTWNGIEEARAVVQTWLELEAAKELPTGCTDEVTFFQVGPVDPLGFVSIPLVGIASELDGFFLTFYAEQLGSPPSVLRVESVSVWSPQGRGLRVVDPTFVVVPAQGGAIVDESLHGDPYVLTSPDDVVLGSGSFLSTEWSAGAKLAIRFAEVERLFADDEGNTFRPCTQLDAFTDAVDALPYQTAPNAPNGLLFCARQCHGGSEGSVPTSIMDLAPLLDEPRDDAFACAVTKAFITATQPAASAIVTETSPLSPTGHPFLFGGNPGSHAAFVTTMTPWIEAEGQADAGN